MVEEVQKGRDGILREVTIKYCNSSEQKLTLEGDSSNDRTMPRYTDRAVRKIVKIFSLEDSNLEHDIAEFRKKMQHMPAGFIDDDQLNAHVNVSVPEHCSLRNSQLGPCCCQEHCVWKTHFNLKHKLEDEDPVHRTVEAGSYVESA